jgi:hypothetical protein
MNEASDDRLRQVFAASAQLGPDESFVATVSRNVAARRRRRGYLRTGLIAASVLLALVLAVTLAPFAPVPKASLGMSMVRLPELLVGLVQAGFGRSLSPYLYLPLLAAVLPLAGTAWLVRRS